MIRAKMVVEDEEFSLQVGKKSERWDGSGESECSKRAMVFRV